MAVGLEHVHLLAPDQKATARWYVDKLGARVVEEYQAFGMNSIALDLMGLRLRVSTPMDQRKLPGSTVEPHYGIDHFGFLVEGLDSVIARLKAHGVEVLVPPQEVRPGLRISYIRGPDNTRIELLEQK